MKRRIPDVILDGRTLSVIVEYQRRKTISLAVKSAGELYFKAPVGLPESRLKEFIEAKENWIKKRIKLMEASAGAGAGSGMTPGRILYYSGTPRTLEVSGSSMIVLRDRIIVPMGFTSDDLDEWYRQQSHGFVKEFIEKNKSAIPNCTFKIRRQRRIWGSCNTKRNININSRISMCRPSAIEYVLWHEICHLKHMDHSKRFYNCLEKVFPDYRAEKKWLRDHEYLLLI
ncbi:MAG: M48 family metallopeptidase [Clostridia bacterium]|nr:M48 family metallopeptidase [Clostridia bacterium]MBN2882047.1 M48 family metallopeptidase [Clostridia bacterium]